MRTTDLFKNNRAPKKLNETIEKTFGRKLNLEAFNIEQLEDARNKLRTQIHTARTQSSFNETVENDALTQAQWMHDAIVAELMDRNEHIVDNTVEEGKEFNEEEVKNLFRRFEDNMNEIGAYGDVDYPGVMELLRAGDVEGAVELFSYSWGDKDGGEVRGIEDYLADLQDELDYVVNGSGDEDDYSHQDTSGDFDQNEASSSDDAVADFLARGGKIQHGKPQKGPRKPGMSFASRHIGGGGDKMKASRTGKGANSLSPKPVGEAAPEGWEGTVKAMKKHKEIDNPYALAHSMKNKGFKSHKKESVETGDDMTKLHEGEIQQASAIVTAKTMVDRVGRWIEELSGMENDTLLQLGDSIRDEMSQDLAKNFISTVAPAIQQALQNLKDTRETLASGVRTLTGEEQPAEMLGGDGGMGGAPEGDLMGPEGGEAEPDLMNAEEPVDDFAAAEPAVGGSEAAGREMRESIQRQNSLLKALAG